MPLSKTHCISKNPYKLVFKRALEESLETQDVEATIWFTINNNDSTYTLSLQYYFVPSLLFPLTSSPLLSSLPFFPLPFASSLPPFFYFRLSKLTRLDQLRHASTCLSPVKLLILASSWHFHRTPLEAGFRLSPSCYVASLLVTQPLAVPLSSN